MGRGQALLVLERREGAPIKVVGGRKKQQQLRG